MYVYGNLLFPTTIPQKLRKTWRVAGTMKLYAVSVYHEGGVIGCHRPLSRLKPVVIEDAATEEPRWRADLRARDTAPPRG